MVVLSDIVVRVKPADQFSAVAVLGDEVRWNLYRFVRRQNQPVTREEAARAARISVKLAAFHLDKLVDRGLLRADQELPHGVHRRVGRAPKRYTVSELEVAVSLPERRYEFVGEILIDSIAQAETNATGESPTALARQIAWERGEGLGARTREERRLGRPGPERTIAAAEELLDEMGYEPSDDERGGLILRNCPFHSLVSRAPELVCSINAAFVDGVLRGMGNETVSAELIPAEGMCCVRVMPQRAVSGDSLPVDAA
jgi:predicted ArsR family transcriptional regulator